MKLSALGSRLSALISVSALSAFWSPSALATCPNGLTNTSCRSICSLVGTRDYDCNTTNAGTGYGSTAYAVSDYTAGYHSVWGIDATNTAFCCEVLGNTVDKLILTGSSLSDYLSLQSNPNTLDDLYGTMDGVVNGGGENDTIYGSRSTAGTYRDALNGDNLGDAIYGDAGDDTINGGSGSDWLYGGEGGDTINGGNDSDYIEGDVGDDTINGDLGDDTIDGGEDNDTIHGNGSNDEIYGHSGNDLIWGDEGDDILHGGDNNDTLRGGDDTDVLCGDDNADALYGESEDDTLWGSGGVNSLNGGADTDECGSPFAFQPNCETQITTEPVECQ